MLPAHVQNPASRAQHDSPACSLLTETITDSHSRGPISRVLLIGLIYCFLSICCEWSGTGWRLRIDGTEQPIRQVERLVIEVIRLASTVQPLDDETYFTILIDLLEKPIVSIPSDNSGGDFHCSVLLNLIDDNRD